MNLCTSCLEDFSSVHYFDRHRVGKHAYTYAEGVKMNPMREDGRRCLDLDEIEALGLARDGKGRWSDPVAAERMREAFSGVQ